MNSTEKKEKDQNRKKKSLHYCSPFLDIWAQSIKKT